MTNEYQGGIEVLVVLLDVVGIVLYCLPLVHRIKVDTGIVCLDGLEEDSESILEAGSSQWSATQATLQVERTTLDRFAEVGVPCHSFQRPPLHDSLYLFRCSPLVGRMERVEQMGGKESVKRGEVACGLTCPKVCATFSTPSPAFPSVALEIHFQVAELVTGSRRDDHHHGHSLVGTGSPPFHRPYVIYNTEGERDDNGTQRREP